MLPLPHENNNENKRVLVTFGPWKCIASNGTTSGGFPCKIFVTTTCIDNLVGDVIEKGWLCWRLKHVETETINMARERLRSSKSNEYTRSEAWYCARWKVQVGDGRLGLEWHLGRKLFKSYYFYLGGRRGRGCWVCVILNDDCQEHKQIVVNGVAAGRRDLFKKVFNESMNHLECTSYLLMFLLSV